MFNFFKKKLKLKQLTLPTHQLKMFLVPIEDLELLKQIRLSIANGREFIIQPTEDIRALKANALILKESYGLSETEVLVETGFWLGERQDGMGEKET